MNPEFCFDTSALIRLFDRYPDDIFPKLWSNFDKLIQSSTIVCPDEVFAELEVKADHKLNWAKKKKKQLFCGLTANGAKNVTQILKIFPDFSQFAGTTPIADPFVIGLAMEKQIAVVTEERYQRPGLVGKTKIPDVCNHYRIECHDLLRFFRACGWSF